MDGLRGTLLVIVCMVVTAHAYEATHDDIGSERGNEHVRGATLSQLVGGYLKREATKHFNYITEMMVGLIKSRQKRGWITGDFGNRATPPTTSTTSTTPPTPPYTGSTESTTESTVTSSSSTTNSSTTSATQSSTSTTETTTVTSSSAKTGLCGHSFVGTLVALCTLMFAHLFV